MSNARAARRRRAREAGSANLTKTYVDHARVVIAWLHREDKTHPLFMTSIVSALMYDAQTNQGAIGAYIALQSGPRITESRNKVCEAFINDPELRRHDGLPHEWLFFVDDDMKFPEDAIHCLLARAEHDTGLDGAPIRVIGGLAFAGNRISMYPTIYGLSRDEEGKLTLDPQEDYPRNSLVRVGATGAACLLIHRDALLAMWMQNKEHPHPWFVEATTEGAQWGEDVAFCIRAQAAGFGVYVDTSVKFGHMKQLCLDEELWEGREVIHRSRITDAIERNGHMEVSRQ